MIYQTNQLTYMVKHLLIINSVVFFIFQLESFRDIIFYYGVLYPIQNEAPSFYPWQFLTYMFLHADLYHLLFNLYVLWMLGGAVERVMGAKRFILYYFLTGIAAGVVHILLFPSSVLGSSGAMYGILLAFGLLFPNEPLGIFFLPVTFPAKYFVLALGLLELLNGYFNASSGIAHFAHLGGFIAGWVLLKLVPYFKRI